MRPLFISCFLLLAFCPDTHAQERHLRTFALRHAMAEQVAPMLSAQLSAGSSVTPYHQQLILNVTDAEYRALQPLLGQLDTAPRSLSISVRKQSRQLEDTERYGVQGRVGSGNVSMRSGDNLQRGDTRAIIDRAGAQSTSDGSQRVRAIEGMEAFIATGNVVSMRSGGYGEREMVPVESGFYATARVVGDEVIVDIDQRDDRVQRNGIATQSLQTQVRGNIGEWIPLGGLASSQSNENRAIGNYASGATSAMTDLAIKVELLPQ